MTSYRRGPGRGAGAGGVRRRDRGPGERHPDDAGVHARRQGDRPCRLTPQLVTAAALRDWPLPSPGGGKESRGRTLVVGGTSRTPGSVLLAAEALLRSGAGKLQIATAQSVAAALSVAVPEAMVCPLPETAAGEIAPSAAGDRPRASPTGCADGAARARADGPGQRRGSCWAASCPSCPRRRRGRDRDGLPDRPPRGTRPPRGPGGADPEPHRARDHPGDGRGRGGRRPGRGHRAPRHDGRRHRGVRRRPRRGWPRPTARLDRGHRRPRPRHLRVRRRQVGDHHRPLRPGLPPGAGRRLGHLPARPGRRPPRRAHRPDSASSPASCCARSPAAIAELEV